MKPKAKNLLLAGALIALPAALYASTGMWVDVPGYGWFGTANTGAYNGVLAVGTNNIINPGVSGTGTAAIGTGLRAYYPNCLVVGQYSDTTAPGTNPVFIVGNGASDSVRGNAVEVWLDGTTLIKRVPPRGGVPMGDFTTN